MIVICECREPCGIRLTLGEREYAALARQGTVVSKWCVQGRRVLDQRGEARAVQTSPAVFAAAHQPLGAFWYGTQR